MKKLLIISNLFWLSIFVFFACTRPLQVGTEDCKTFCYDFRFQPFPGLNSNAAKKMVKNYSSLYQITSSSGTTVTDQSETTSVWFSLESIKNFIYQIETSTCKLKCNATDMSNLGIRIYFAKYPSSPDSDFSFLTATPQHYGRKTLFMVPTYSNGTDDVDFDPRWSLANDSTKCAPVRLKRIMDSKASTGIGGAGIQLLMFMPLSNPDPNGMQNHQPVCPPFNCPDTF